MPEQKQLHELPKSGSKLSKRKAKVKKKRQESIQQNEKCDVKLNRKSASNSYIKESYFGAKKLPSITPDPVVSNKQSASRHARTFKSLVRSSSASRSIHLTPVSRTSSRTSCLKSRTILKSNPQKSPSRSLTHISQSSSDEVQIGSGDAKKTRRKKQNILVAIRPCNVESERVRFMARKFDYDPRFVYTNPPSDEDLSCYPKPSKQLLDQAIQILHIALKKYGTYENFAAMTGGVQIPRREFTRMFKEYVTKEGLGNKVLLNLGEEIVSRAVMTRRKGKPCLSVKVSTLREKWAPGLLRHELGTHYLRGSNNKHQPWHSNKTRESHNLRPANRTEEGLASIHSVLCRDDPNMWRAALLYYTTYKASVMSFSDLFHDLEKFVSDPDTRWEYCVRAKRGLVDTSKPGCFSKDQVYLTGVLELLRYRHRIDFHSLVRLGKVAYQDVERLKPKAVLDPKTVKIPFFMEDIKEYKAQLHYIMTKNGLTDVELAKLYPDVPGDN